MGIRKYNPTTPGRRGATVSDFAELTPGAKREKSLLRPKVRTNGRNNQGKITSRHRGGGHKRAYRLIDFRRNKDGVPAKVDSIQYDPNRSARIALVELRRWREALHRCPARPEGWRHGDEWRRSAADGRQLLAAVEDSVGHRDSQRRTTSWSRRLPLPQCRHQRHAHGPRGRLGSDFAAER